MCRYGCPEVLITDQGREFVNAISSELCAMTKTASHNQCISPPGNYLFYTHEFANFIILYIILLFIQTNGLTECFNQTLSRCLAKVVADGQEDWDEKLHTVLMGYRASRQATTKHSSYYMPFQKETRLPIDNEVMPQEDSAQVDVSELMEKLLKTR